jgi:hypothetical protein
VTTLRPEFRRQFPRVAAFLCLATLSTIVLVDHIRVRSSQTEEAKARIQDAAALDHKLGAIDRRLDSIAQQPPSVSESRFASSSRTLDARLARIEQALAMTSARQDLAALNERVTTLETRVKSQVSRPSTRSTDHTQPIHQQAEPSEPPPFTPIGTEMRGGVQFLSLMPPGAHSSSEIRLLQCGDSEGDWMLEAIEGKSAVFRIHGRTERITLP